MELTESARYGSPRVYSHNMIEGGGKSILDGIDKTRVGERVYVRICWLSADWRGREGGKGYSGNYIFFFFAQNISPAASTGTDRMGLEQISPCALHCVDVRLSPGGEGEFHLPLIRFWPSGFLNNNNNNKLKSRNPSL